MRVQTRKCRAFRAQVELNDNDAIQTIANCLGLSSGFSGAVDPAGDAFSFNRIGSEKIGIEKSGR